MKLVHVITGLDTGGAEVALCRLLESLPADEYEHTVVALGGEGALSERVVVAGARLVCLHMIPSAPNPVALLRLRRLMREERPNLVHGWMYHANVAASLAAYGTALPVLWGIRHSVYVLAEEKLLTRLVILAGARVSARTSAVVYNARISARQHEALGYRSDKALVIPNGFDTEQFRPDAARGAQFRREWDIPLEALVVGLVARLHPVKGHDSFLRAATLFVNSCPNVVFVLAGDGLDATNAAMVERLASLGLSDRVRLCGRQLDTAAVNAALDIATCSSSSEAFPNTIGEAMACGVPCVATDVGDVREIMGDTGLVVPSRDPEALCAGWLHLARIGEEGRRALGARARQRIIERYSIRSVSQQYTDLYRRIGGG